jgi:gamma-glutamyltranspeptidase/glutathione hydrolase
MRGVRLDSDVVHAWIEILRHAFEARAEVMGDPDVVADAVDALLSAGMGRDVRSSRSANARASLRRARCARGLEHEPHLSMLDRDGNAVA